MNYLLDTNFLILIVRKNKSVIEWVKRKALFDNNTIISIVNKGEMLSFAKRRKWGRARIQSMNALIDSLYMVTIRQNDIVDAYAEIDTYSQGKLGSVGFTARNMGKNDLWIAATAYITKATLVTTDKDFDHLKDRFIKVMYLDPITLRG